MKHKISFCTVSMNRLHHLKQTLPKNIQGNEAYADIEFVILDYNSSDGLFNWIHNEGREYLNHGLVKYFRYNDALIFDRSHSRNMCFRLAEGDILCNVDADSFTGDNFANFVNESFSIDPDIFLSGDETIRDAIGKVCVRRNDFLLVSGYNEKMTKYGYEDIEFYNRLIMSGKRQDYIRDLQFLRSIHHNHDDRISNEELYQGLKKLFIGYVSPFESELILLYENYAIKVILINYLGSFIKENEVRIFSYSNNLIFLKQPLVKAPLVSRSGEISWSFVEEDKKFKIVLIDDEIKNVQSDIRYYEMHDIDFRNNILLLLSEVENKYTMYSYLVSQKQTNESGFGKGVVDSYGGVPFELK